jgi:hypothetical protein
MITHPHLFPHLRTVCKKPWLCLTPSATHVGLSRLRSFSSSIRLIDLPRNYPSAHCQIISQTSEWELHGPLCLPFNMHSYSFICIRVETTMMLRAITFSIDLCHLTSLTTSKSILILLVLPIHNKWNSLWRLWTILLSRTIFEMLVCYNRNQVST